MPVDEVVGLGDLRENFRKLGDGMKTRAGRAMVVAAGGVLKRKAKENIVAMGLVKSGAMKKNVAIKRERDSEPDEVQYNLGVRSGYHLTKKQKEKGADDPYYWKFLEDGTKFITPKNFLKNALEQGKEEAIAAMQDRLAKELEKVGK